MNQKYNDAGTWDPPSGDGSGLFLNFKDGEKFIIRFTHRPIPFTKVWEGQTRQRFGALVLVHPKGEDPVVKVYEFGPVVMRALADLAKDDDWGDPTTYDVAITRSGVGRDTKYAVLPRTKKPLPDASQAIVNECDIDLFKVLKIGEFAPHSEDEFDAFAEND